jgi:hypothetical protein
VAIGFHCALGSSNTNIGSLLVVIDLAVIDAFFGQAGETGA